MKGETRQLKLSHAILLCALLLASLGFAHKSDAADEPRIKAPRFPLEPGKKPEQPINPKSYVEGADEPPLSDAERAEIPRLARDEGKWWTLLQIGWFYGSVSSTHAFTSPRAIPTFGSLRRTNHNLLNLAARYEARLPRLPVSLALDGAASYGTAEAGLPLAIDNITRFNAQNYRGAAGLRVHALPRRSIHDIRLGADVGLQYFTYATLTPDLTQVDADNRNTLHVTPKIEYRVAPSPNWNAEISGGYVIPLRTSGLGDVTVSDYQRIEGELSFLRYVETASAFGLGAVYAYEKATWSQTSPFELSDSVRTQDLSLNVFWRGDF
jgi:hypothetical protein